MESAAIQCAIKLLRRIPHCGIIENVGVEPPFWTRQLESLKNYLGSQPNHAEVDQENRGPCPGANTARGRTRGHSDPRAVEGERCEVGTCGTHSLHGSAVLQFPRSRERLSISRHNFWSPLQSMHFLHNPQQAPIAGHFGWFTVWAAREALRRRRHTIALLQIMNPPADLPR